MSRLGIRSETVLRPTRVLLVDDERMVLRALRRLVLARHPDWDVLCARDASDASSLLERFQPIDVLVTDLRMPGADGLGLLRIAKEHYPGTIRVVHSAHVESYGHGEVGRLTFAVLSKPAGAAEFIATLELASRAALLDSQRVAG